MTRFSTRRPTAARLAVGAGAASLVLVAALWAATGPGQRTPVPSIAHDFAGNHLHGIGYVPGTGLYLATHYGLFLLADGALYQIGEMRDDLMGFTRHPGDPETFYASGHPRTGGNLGVIVSRDGGLGWEQIFAGLGEETVDFHSMVASPADPERLYGVFGSELYVGDTGARAWHAVSDEAIALEGFCWGVACLAAAADDPDRLFAGTPEGLHVSEDAGQSWRRLPADTGAVAGVGTHPEAADLLMAHTESYGVALSQDGGATWTARSEGLALDGRDFIFGFAFDPANRDRAFAASVQGLVFETDDAGRSWRLILGHDGPPT